MENGVLGEFEKRRRAADWSLWCNLMRRLLIFSLQGGVGNRQTSRSKYGTKKPKKAVASV